MKKLFVSGFPLEITELELAQLIAPYGDIATLKIVRDKKTKKCKGYAFVEMVTEKGAAVAASALNGVDMSGRELTVNVNTESVAKPAATQFYTRVMPKKDSWIEERPKRPRRRIG